MGLSSSRPLRYISRWFCYFDLLGFSSRVHDDRLETIIPAYQEVVAEIEQRANLKAALGITYSWFSDTFILFSKRATDQDFANVEQAGRLFFVKLLAMRIPVRGAMTIGGLYSQSKRNIFLGPALIDAYCYGEKQNWLGFLMTPSVYNKFKGTTLDLERRPFYRRVEAENVITHEHKKDVFAFAFNNGASNGRNMYLTYLQEMRDASDPQYHVKYDNTIKFLELHSK